MSPHVRVVKIWTKTASEQLRDHFDPTHWGILCSPHGEDRHSLTELNSSEGTEIHDQNVQGQQQKEAEEAHGTKQHP